MQTSEASQSTPRILWLQVGGLAAVQGAISLVWVIYNIYLPDLLQQLGQPRELAIALLVIENTLAIVMEPIAGGLSDRSRGWLAGKFPFIAVGILASSVLFLAIPIVVIFGRPFESLHGLLPDVIVLWALAMTLFRSPALSLLRECATTKDLPQAASILTFMNAAVGTLRPLSQRFILGLGAGLTFTIGSLSLIGAAAVLRATMPPATTPSEDAEREVHPPTITIELLILIFATLFLTGLGAGWGVRTTMGEVLPRWLGSELQGVSLDLSMGAVSLLLAGLAISAGWLARKIGNALVMGMAAVCVAIAVGLTAIVHGFGASVILAIVLVAGLSGVLNGAVPLALTLAPARWGGLSVGMYFGGFSAAMALFGLAFPNPSILTMHDGILIAALSFIGVAVCVQSSTLLQKMSSPSL